MAKAGGCADWPECSAKSAAARYRLDRRIGYEGAMGGDSEARARVRAAANFDEARVPPYTLPDPLTFADGTPVRDASQWPRRRAEILAQFERCVYGRTPAMRGRLRCSPPEEGAALGGLARYRSLDLEVEFDGGVARMEVLVLTPAMTRGRVPVFAALNFAGNQSLCADPALPVSSAWQRDHPGAALERGSEARRWSLETVLAAGFGLATMYNGDVEPDRADGWRDGVRPLFFAPDQDRPADDEWGAIGVWAWGLSRVLDAVATLEDVDADRVIALGHSRLGKAALWAGAQDQRFAAVVSSCSGCCGAALSRRRFGERQSLLRQRFPHWLCRASRAWDEREAELPVDQHLLLAAIAPRPLYVASAADDLWADPRGEFLSAVAADPVYRLLGVDGLPATVRPAVDHPQLGTIGYHCRRGEHDLTAYDWKRFLDFADRHGWNRAG